MQPGMYQPGMQSGMGMQGGYSQFGAMNLQAVHPHQLMQGMLMKDCSACKNGKKGIPGFNCAQCQEVALCQNYKYKYENLNDYDI